VKSIQYEGQDLFYKIEGQGAPVVLLHGFLENHSMWKGITPVLIKMGCQVVSIDLPCHGNSRFFGEECSMIYMAKGVAAIFNQENIQNPHLFGHSMGGYVGLELLKMRPIQLTLVHSNFWEDTPTKKKDRNRVIEIVENNKNRFVREAIPNLFAPENRDKNQSQITTLIEQACQIPAYEIQASTAGMRDRNDNSMLLETNPIAIIHGENDPIIPTEKLVAALNEVSNPSPYFLIKDCGHMSIWEASETLIKSMNKLIFP